MNNQKENHNSNGHQSQIPVTDVKQKLDQNGPTAPVPPPVIDSEPVCQQQNQPTSNPSSTHINSNPTNGNALEKEKAKVWELTNAERQREGVPPLKWSSKLCQSAQAHARDMAIHSFCSHVGSEGSTLLERVAAVEYSFSYVGENCAAGQTNAQEVVRGWMKSPGHRSNILNPDYTHIGIGYVNEPSSSHRHYWVQNFGIQSEENQIPTSDFSNKPDVWNKALVALFVTFYFSSLVSTYVSTNLLLYLLSGGAAITVPMFGIQVPITEAVALMGTGILEGASLSDAYLEHKKHFTKNKTNKWLSRGGRSLAFVAQGLLYYMALGQMLFGTVDVNSLEAEGLESYENSPRTEASLILEPPTALHGIFVGTISFAWSFATAYVGPTATLVAIDRLRRKRSQKPQAVLKLDNGLVTKSSGKQTDVKSVLDYWHNQINKEIQLHLYDNLMKHQVEEMKMLQRGIDRGLNEISNLPEQTRRHALDIVKSTPSELLEKAGLTRDQAVLLFKQQIAQTLPSDTATKIPNIPSDWKKS